MSDTDPIPQGAPGALPGPNRIPKACTIVLCLLVRGRYAQPVPDTDLLRWTAKARMIHVRARGSSTPPK